MRACSGTYTSRGFFPETSGRESARALSMPSKRPQTLVILSPSDPIGTLDGVSETTTDGDFERNVDGTVDGKEGVSETETATCRGDFSFGREKKHTWRNANGRRRATLHHGQDAPVAFRIFFQLAYLASEVQRPRFGRATQSSEPTTDPTASFTLLIVHSLDPRSSRPLSQFQKRLPNRFCLDQSLTHFACVPFRDSIQKTCTI